MEQDLTYDEIERKIENGRKSNYDNYTEESKMEYRALKTLQERIRIKSFRDFFVEKKYLYIIFSLMLFSCNNSGKQQTTDNFKKKYRRGRMFYFL
jgi:hypothetical protein